MSYSAELTQDAIDELESLPISPTVLAGFYRNMRALELDPIGRYERPELPFSNLDSCLYQFLHREEGKGHFFSVYFHFHEDERTLVVSHIGYALYR